MSGGRSLSTDHGAAGCSASARSAPLSPVDWASVRTLRSPFAGSRQEYETAADDPAFDFLELDRTVATHSSQDPFVDLDPARPVELLCPSDDGVSRSTPSGFEPTARRFADYELLSEIARGGMGVIHKARQISLNRLVALKMIATAQLASDSDIARFHVEAEAAAGLDHPNIVPIYEVGVHDGQHYFSMKLVESGSLAKQVPRMLEDPRAAARIMLSVARAVHAAHQHGVLHRDLKPSNILVDSHGEPLVSDFGLAKRAECDSQLTQSGVAIGTPSYMAPEQASGIHPVTTAVDVYGLGAVLYELLTGRPPFKAASAVATMRELAEKEPQRPRTINRQVNRDLETIALKALEKSPAKRFGSAEAFGDDLSRWLAGEPIEARRVTMPERALKWARRRPTIAALCGLIVLVASLGFAGVLWQWQNALINAALANAKELEANGARQDAERQRDKIRTTNEQLGDALERLRRTAYVANVNWAHRELEDANVGRALALLDAEQPSSPDSTDLRGFEWYYLRRLCRGDHRVLAGHAEALTSLSYNRAGSRLVAGSRDGTVSVWDPSTGKLLHMLTGHTDQVLGVALSQDGTRIASASRDRTVKVWDARTGNEALTFRGHTESVRCVAFTPVGHDVASGGFDKVIKIWDADTGLEREELLGHKNVILGLAFSPDGSQLASASLDETARLWDLASGGCRELRGHKISVEGVAFNPNGSRLATASRDGTVKVWNVHSGLEALALHGHKSYVHAVAFSHDGRTLASAGFDRIIRTWDSNTGQELVSLRGHLDAICALQFSPNDLQIASASNDHTVCIWDATHRQGALVLKGHTGPVWGLAFSPDGSRLASASVDRTLRIWDPIAGKEEQTLRGHTFVVKAVAYSGDGSRMVSAGLEKTVRLWNPVTGENVVSFVGHANELMSAAINSDGTRVASVGRDKTARIWDSTTGASLTVFRGHTESLDSVAFRPRSVQVASGDAGGVVKIWDSVSGAELRSFRAHTNSVLDLTYSHDGKILATAGRDGHSRLWDAEGGANSLTSQVIPASC
jgi:WD40 repeat protein